MSTPSSSLSSRAASPSVHRPGADEETFPVGHCRFILLNPEIKGQRCACVGFTLNRTAIGATCQCGHQPCYHVKSPPIHEMEELRRRVEMLEGQQDRREQSTSGGIANDELVHRVGNLEEQLETSRLDFSQEIKDCYGNVNRVWVSFDQLDKRHASIESRLALYDERLESYGDALQRIQDKMGETSMATEERAEVLEDSPTASRSRRHRFKDRTSTAETDRNNSAALQRQWLQHYGGTLRPQPVMPPAHGSTQTAFGSAALSQVRVPWTVHVSLLPTAAQPFPFEKDTNAYKRCLSRGLHQMIAVGGTDSESFRKAVNKAFGSLLRGREWMPLQARLCDAVTLEGLPMLRRLDPGLLGRPYDLDFLRQHCAVCHPTGKVESLYIAMVHDTFSWHFLRRSPCHLEGLEASWDYDPLLDPDDNLDDDTEEEEGRPPAGDIMQPLPSLKRTASEISRAPSFGAADGDGSRPKLARIQVEVCRRGVETA
ncbi:hypothetical protein F5Y17DRAFT_420774 [Xylariaceae sp. FL0594]|nr:hypothetical protein F5Y17DRAFT_420774 [Xylariaceae sp. FL0594]